MKTLLLIVFTSILPLRASDAFSDPKTGKVRKPDAAEARKAHADLRRKAAEKSGSSEKPRVLHGPGGATGVEIKGPGSQMVATKGPDGKISIQCLE